MHGRHTVINQLPADVCSVVDFALCMQPKMTGSAGAVLLCQVLEFQTKPDMTMEMWTDRQQKIQGFFGPGIKADIQKTDKVSCCPIFISFTDTGSENIVQQRLQHRLH